MVLIFANISHPLFRRDILNIICRNKGEIVVVSYKQEYVQPRIGNLHEQEGLVVFADYDLASGEYRYHPIRKVRILQTDIMPQEQPILLQLKMEDLIGYSSNIATNRQLIQDFHLEVEQDALSPKAPRQMVRLGVPKGFFVCNIDPQSLRNFNQSNNDYWLDMCYYLGKETELKKCVFFRQGASKLDLGIKSDKNMLLKIVSDKAYALNFQVSVGEDAKVNNHYPQIFTNDNISCHGPLVSQYKAAMRAEYVIVARSSLASINTSLTMKVKRDNEEFISPEISHLVIIRPPRFIIWLVVFLFLTGIIALNLKDHVAENDLYYIGYGWYVEAKKLYTAFGIGAPLIGAIIATRKLSFFTGT